MKNTAMSSDAILVIIECPKDRYGLNTNLVNALCSIFSTWYVAAEFFDIIE